MPVVVLGALLQGISGKGCSGYPGWSGTIEMALRYSLNMTFRYEEIR